MIKVELPDGSVLEIKKRSTVFDVAEKIGPGLAKAALAGKVNQKLVDISYELKENCELEIITERSDEALDLLNHSAAHILADAVVDLFPNAKPTIGPAIEPVGFYYDFYVDKPFTQEDLEEIERRMKEIIEEESKFVRQEMPIEEAKEYYRQEEENKFKIELLEEFEDQKVSFYTHGESDFKDLCRGPHLPSTGHVKAVKVLNTSSAFWRGDAKSESLQRIYGVAFFSKKELRKHLNMLKEAKRRDHRVLGPQLDLFDTADEYGPGMPLYYPKGTVLWNVMEEFWKKEHKNANYEIVKTPHLFKESVWQTSGHVEYFLENMFPVDMQGEKWYVKPMNCPGHMMIYNRSSHSYRELPLRYAEYGTVYRYEMSGVLHGLLRVRGFTQDDAHLFMLPEQLEDEIVGVIQMVEKFYKTYGFDEWEYFISTKPEKAIGEQQGWDHAINALRNALKRIGKDFKVKEGEGAFYGPKIDVDVKDAIGRRWQLATIQVDFNLPERFDITYVGEDGQKHKPFVIHRVIYGAVDRFLAILIEHYAGKLPIWLSPVQAVLIPVTDRNIEYADKVREQLEEAGIRADVDNSAERMEYKIRQAQLKKIPYMLTVGDKEVEKGTIAVRTRDGEVEFGVEISEFIKEVKNAIKKYK